MKFLRYIFGFTILLALCACRQDISSKQSFQSTGGHTPVSTNAPIAPASSGDSALVAQTNGMNKASATKGQIYYIDASVDYGAELLLVDAQGHQTGYDPSVHHKVKDISGASYVDESITDVTDNSDDPAVGESKRLHFIPAQGSSYLLHVIPTDRPTYQLEFKCMGSNGSAHLQGIDLGISSGEEHVFSIAAIENCSESFITGAFANPPTQSHPLLSYAFPASGTIKIASGATARIVVAYDKDILPSSFIATLNGEAITQLFHPKAATIESVILPTKRGDNFLQLSITNTRNQSGHSIDNFTIHVD